MNYKKLFFPIGGGEELEERLYAALLIAKTFNTKLEILKCGLKTNIGMYKTLAIPSDILNKINEVVDNKYIDENNEIKILFEKVAKRLDVNIVKEDSNEDTFAYLKIKEGLRSVIIEQESKFCDLVIVAAPPMGVTTATFETAVLKSGKPVLMFPRKMKKFAFDSIIIGWNNSVEASRAVSLSIELLKQAQRVHIVSSLEYSKDNEITNNLISYLNEHNIDASYEIIETTKISGQALINAALDGDFDLIVAGAYGYKGLKELMFGGATRYLLENSSLPVFMSH